MEITPELILLRTALASPALRPGAVVAARVIDRATLSLLGARVAAKLPDDVRPGDVLRLHVKESTPERITLQVVQQPPPVATAAVMLPGGATARVIKDDDEEEAGGAGGRAARAVTLRYDSATLGRLDIRLSAAGATVHVSEGPPADAARSAAGELAGALRAPVAVIARRSVLDAQA
jgi:hypothetical protein